MGTDAAPFVANLLLHEMEYIFMQNLMTKNMNLAKRFKYVFRYIDDITIVNDEGFFEEIIDIIYPSKNLKLIKVNELQDKADVLDIAVKLDDGLFETKVYDKRRDFPFNVVNMPYFYSFISEKVLKNVISNEINRYFRICSNKNNFLTECVRFKNLLITRDYPLHFIRKNFLRAFSSANFKFIKHADLVYIFE